MDGIDPPNVMKETTMFSTKNILAAASLAILTAAGIGGASAQPWDHRFDRREAFRHERMEYRINHRIAENLRFRGLRMVSEPPMFRDHMVVRAQDRFGRLLIVHVNPYSGAVTRVIRL